MLFPAAASLAAGSEPKDHADIRAVMMSTWDKPEAPLEVGPIVLVDARAIAGWTQGSHGGRALLTRNAQGQWQVSVCGGDGLKDAKTLEMTGMSASAAQQMAKQVARAEAAIPAQRRKMFSTFEGMLKMGPSGAHPGAAH